MTDRTGRVAALVAVLLVVVAAAHVRPVQGRFEAQLAGIDGVFALTAVYAPSSLVATSTATDVSLSWGAGRNSTGYTVSGAPTGTPGSCAGVAFSTLAATAATSYVDTGRNAPAGRWYCYLVESRLAQWTSVEANPTAAVQLGFVASAVAISNGGVAGKLDVGDRVVVTFNQPVSSTTGPTAASTVCATTSGAVVLGATATNGGCTAGEANRLGQLNGGAMSHNVRWSASYVWSDQGRSLTVTLLSKVAGPNAEFTTGTWLLQPTTSTSALLSATGGVHVCDSNAGGAACLPQTTGAF